MGIATTLKRRLIALIPDSVQMRLRPRLFGFGPADIPDPIQPPKGSMRLLIAPVNFAGQGYEWARAAERIPEVGARSMAYVAPGAFAFPADYTVPTPVFIRSRDWQRRQARAVTRGFTHVIMEAERPIFGQRYGEDVQRDGRQVQRAHEHDCSGRRSRRGGRGCGRRGSRRGRGGGSRGGETQQRRVDPQGRQGLRRSGRACCRRDQGGARRCHDCRDAKLFPCRHAV